MLMRPLGLEPRTQSLKLLILPLNYTLFCINSLDNLL
jgi:hypothetical protein